MMNFINEQSDFLKKSIMMLISITGGSLGATYILGGEYRQIDIIGLKIGLVLYVLIKIKIEFFLNEEPPENEPQISPVYAKANNK